MFNQSKTNRHLHLGIAFLLAAMLSIGQIFAQNVNVRGKVTDQNGEPVVGLAVVVQGTKTGTSTDANGAYSINVPSNGTLVFQMLGYKDVVVPVNGRSVIDVTMTDDATLLDDVVITAMGIKKDRKALGYAVQDLKADEITKNRTSNAVQSLAGKISGVNVTQSSGSAGAGANIVIRGGTSLERDNQPLFVVDGIIYDNGTNIGGNSGFDGMVRTSTSQSNRVMDISTEDIENISVLKGPAAAALYGSRAAAGVVLITTKKGTAGPVSVNFSSKYTSSWVNRYPEEQRTYMRGTYLSDGTLSDHQILDSWGAKSTTTMYNNIKDFFETSHIFDNSVAISGGSDKGSFYLSVSRYDQGGIVPATSFDKNTFRFNGDQKYNRLTVGVNAAYSVSHTTRTLTSGGLYNSGGIGAMNSVYAWPQSEDMTHYLNDDGTKYRMFPAIPLADDFDNPYWIVNKNRLTERTNRFTGAVTLDYKFTDWWNLTYRLGYDNYVTRDYNLLYPGAGVREQYQNGKLSENDIHREYLSSNLMMNFHKQFGDFDLNGLLGWTAEDTKRNTERRNGWNFILEEPFSFANISNDNKRFQSIHSRKRLMGVYGEIRASYKNIAYLTLTGRNDWSSTLPKDNRSYFYPSISGSFVFTELMPKSNILSFGKIRGSWAEVGKDTDAYVTNTYLWSAIADLAGPSVGNSWQRGNPYLKPERTRSWEIGTELRFFNGRLGLDYTFYNNKSIDQIIVPRLSQATGYILLSVNCGSIRNKGMELAITGTPIAKKDLTWDLTLNLSGNRGRVYDLLDGQEILYVTDVQLGNAKAASFGKGGKFMGISGSKWKRTPSGELVVNKADGLPVSGPTDVYIANREPKMIGGLNSSLQYKNWNLSFLFDFRVGGAVFNGTDYYMTTHGTSKRSEARESVTITGRYITGTDADGNDTYSDPISTTYKAGQMYDVNGVSRSGEYMIRSYYGTLTAETASYITNTNWLRLRSISLSYDFRDLIKNVKFIKGATATISGNNLWLLTNYKGMDPETSAAGSGVIGSSSVGIDYCGVPATAGVSFGINLTF